ncbi:hypothetical protein [Streptomyces sp. Inha503]|uniref:hypothetical protein n=1 Tax=Streptomyces sp. Inha503 TaxID=3383314 RepID=UPI0039A3B3A7
MYAILDGTHYNGGCRLRRSRPGSALSTGRHQGAHEISALRRRSTGKGDGRIGHR